MPIAPCPYCGLMPASPDVTRCTECNGLFEINSRKATQLAMGPWFIRDEARPFMPGFNLAILREQVKAGRITGDTIVRGPTTNQFWVRADQAPGLSRLLGKCHQCGGRVSPEDQSCSSCQAELSLPEALDTLGLMYLDASDRSQAQREIQASRQAAANPRAAKPVSTPKPAPSTKPTNKPFTVDPNLMKLVDSDPAPPTAKPTPPEAAMPEPEPQNDKGSPANHQPATPADIAEDLWHTTGQAAPRRRRKRNNGPDPLLVGMGALFFIIVTGGLIVIALSGGDEQSDAEENEISTAPAEPALPSRTAEQVSSMRSLAIPRFEKLSESSIPSELEDERAEIKTLIEQAKTYEAAGEMNLAYEQFKQARDRVAPLETKIANWAKMAEAREAVEQLLKDVQVVRSEAEDAEAVKWAPVAWEQAGFSLNEANTLIEAGEFVKAKRKLEEANETYRSAFTRADLAGAAVGKRDTMLQTMAAGPSEQSLRKTADKLLDAFTEARAEGDRLLSKKEYEQAEQAYAQAIEALTQAQQAVELARFGRYYACDAGFKAAGIMLAVASDSDVEQELLQQVAEAYTKLGLSPNPSELVHAGKGNAFDTVTKALVSDARDAIVYLRGSEVQACYLAGFHMRIIDQTLNATSYDNDKKKRVHQSLGVIQEQATAAGWDIKNLNTAIESVRAANRTASSGQPPTRALERWKRFYEPFTRRDRAMRILDPVQFPSDELQDPELFPDLEP